MVSVKDRELLDIHELTFVEHEIDDAIKKGHIYKREYEQAILFNMSILRLNPVLFKYIEEGGWNYIYYKDDDRIYRTNDSINIFFSEKPLFTEDYDKFNYYINDYHLLCRDGDDKEKWYKGILASFNKYRSIIGLDMEEENEE